MQSLSLRSDKPLDATKFMPWLQNLVASEGQKILRSKGIIPEKPPSPTPMIEEALNEARRLAHENRLEGKELDELAELEDEEDEDFLESYR